MERDYDRDRERQPKGLTLGGTGGAVPVRNDKGEITMQKVKVQRYVAGKRPKYAGEESSSEEEISEQSDNEVNEPKHYQPNDELIRANAADDRRLKRLTELDKEPRRPRNRQIAEPEVLMEESMEESVEEPAEIVKEESEEEEEEISADARAAKRLELKKRALQRQEECLAIEEEQKGSDTESDESEYSEDEEYSDSEDEVAPRLKPVFVRKKDRVTIREQEIEAEKEKLIELEKERLHAESKKQTRKLIEDEVAREKISEKMTDENIKCEFDTDEDNEETDYELWKLRELKRIKRDRDEKENVDKDKLEIQRIRNMTEEERQNYMRANPKTITNSTDKGKYKFLQKYYHRGAFFLDKEEDVLSRNIAEPTLEDHFDKTILPKVMQVKNFGMAGRTKYTHLLDQDTTRIEDNPWSSQEKFISGKGGGTKQVFDKPTSKKRK